MGITERRTRARENLKQAILDAAEAIFLAEDHPAVSIRRIAEKIEYSPTTIYLYFKDKQEILYQLIEKGADMLADRLEAVRDADPLERLYQGGVAYIRFALEQPQYYKLTFQVEDPDLAARCGEDLKPSLRSFAFLGQALAEGQASGQIRTDLPVEILAHVLWAQMHGAASLALSERLRKLPADAHQAFFEAAARVVIDGLRAG